MWNCLQCGKQNNDNRYICWKCSTAKGSYQSGTVPTSNSVPPPAPAPVTQAVEWQQAEVKLSTKQSSKIDWSTGIIIASSIPIVLIIIGIIAMIGGAGRTDPVTGITDTTVENAVLLGGLYLALPCGLLDVVVGTQAQSRDLLKEKIKVIGNVIGILGIIMGLISWIFAGLF
jgi:hypothetical protein